MVNLGLVASLALILPTSVLSLATHQNFARQSNLLCPSLPTSNGGRKVGIVIDSSSSNTQTDPNRLRIAAGKQLNSALVQTDLVTVIGFSSSATTLYPLGNPAGAANVFDKIPASGGTSIYSGVKQAIDELTKPNTGNTTGQSGIVVLTDGEDSSITQLIAQLTRAQSLGIRVSFGFLSPTLPAGVQTLLTAILNTGGRYGTISNAAGQQSFINSVLLNGLTGNDNGSGASVLYPDVAIAGRVSSTESQTYSYTAQPGEKLNFTVLALSGQTLDLTLRDAKASTDIAKASTDAKGRGSLIYDATSTIDLGLVISTTNTTSGLYTVGVNSSLGTRSYSGQCNITTSPPKK